MKKIISRTLITILMISLASMACGQGCSDAGVCTMNSFKPHGDDSASVVKNQFKIGVAYGSADNSISVFGNYLEYNRIINEKISIDAKLNALSQSGNDISVYNLSDIFLNINLQLIDKLKLTVGTKIPLTDGNKAKDNLSLPMDYQASLGTFDLVVGVASAIKNIQVVIAFQQPLTQNSNAFIADMYPVNSKLYTFQSTNYFKRSGDALIRISYPVSLGNKFKFTPSILPIYHLANDKFTDLTGVESVIEGSQGLTLNGNIYLDYKINDKNVLQLNAGMPFMVRDARPDGLTRHFIVNFEYRIKF